MNIHHATLFEGSGEMAKKHAISHIPLVHDITIQGNPDVHILEIEKFTIDEARILKERAYKTPLGEKQVFVVITDRILREAQNALLKLFEEPAPHTYFIVTIPSKHLLLSTVLSRMDFQGKISGIQESEISDKKFLSATIGERKKMVAHVIKEKDRRNAKIFLNSLEETLHEDVTKNHASLHEVALAQKYITDTSSSVKMLLEHVCVTI